MGRIEHPDPKEGGPKPPFPEQQQDLPGSTRKMEPTPDHGEESYRGTGRLNGKTALITGADSGIGRAVAVAFAREGADVLISYLNEEADARETAGWVKKAGRKAILVDRAFSDFGHLDLLINNAAMQTVHQEVDEWSFGRVEQDFPRQYLRDVLSLP